MRSSIVRCKKLIFSCSVPVVAAALIVGTGSAAAPFVPNAKAQDTLTLGVTAWL